MASHVIQGPFRGKAIPGSSPYLSTHCSAAQPCITASMPRLTAPHSYPVLRKPLQILLMPHNEAQRKHRSPADLSTVTGRPAAPGLGEVSWVSMCISKGGLQPSEMLKAVALFWVGRAT